jgi:hypothetical protein
MTDTLRLPEGLDKSAVLSLDPVDKEPLVKRSRASGRRGPAFTMLGHGAAGADGGSEVAEDRHGHLPAQALVGDALADGEVAVVGELLAAGDEETLEHDADDTRFAGGDLVGDGVGHHRLAT